MEKKSLTIEDILRIEKSRHLKCNALCIENKDRWKEAKSIIGDAFGETEVGGFVVGHGDAEQKLDTNNMSQMYAIYNRDTTKEYLKKTYGNVAGFHLALSDKCETINYYIYNMNGSMWGNRNDLEAGMILEDRYGLAYNKGVHSKIFKIECGIEVAYDDMYNMIEDLCVVALKVVMLDDPDNREYFRISIGSEMVNKALDGMDKFISNGLLYAIIKREGKSWNLI